MLDVEKFVKGMHDYMEKQLSPVIKRLKALELRQPEKGDKGEAGERGADGKSIGEAELQKLFEENVAVWALDFERRASDLLQKAIDKIPVPKDGKDGAAGVAGAAGRDGVDGKDGAAGVAGAAGRDGVDGKDGAAGLDGEKGERGEPGLNGKDGVDGTDGKNGVDGADGVHGKDGKDGSQGADGKNGIDGARGESGIAGKDGVDGKNGSDGINGKDGRDGIDGKDGKDITEADLQKCFDRYAASWALDFERRAADALQKSIDKIKQPENGKDGCDGTDGKDGFGFDDLSIVQLTDKRLKFVFESGERKKEFVIDMPIVIDCGVFGEGKEYKRGDAVTYGGSLWIAQKDNPNQSPGNGSEWRLAVKHGKDAKGS